MAAPHVSGITARLLNSGINPGQIKERLINTVEDLGAANRDDKYGYGLIDINQALGLETNNNSSQDNSTSNSKNNSENLSEIQLSNVKIYTVREGNKINPETGITNPDTSGNFSIQIQTGNWKVIAWLDKNNNSTLDSGDYWGERENIDIGENDKKKIDIDINQIQ